jgi:glutamine amidotransferase
VTTTLIDSPVANVANIARALRACGATLELTRDAEAVRNASRIVLPGVGSFGAAMSWLTATAIDDALRDAVSRGAWLLGICVGHQVLFEKSFEMGETRGLGLLAGEVQQLTGPLPIPQIGWNRVSCSVGLRPTFGRVEDGGRPEAHTTRGLFNGIPDGTSFYFVNSYAARGVDAEIASADYGGAFTAAVQRERVFGVQFHPEKSSAAGLSVLRNFLACN